MPVWLEQSEQGGKAQDEDEDAELWGCWGDPDGLGHRNKSAFHQTLANIKGFKVN